MEKFKEWQQKLLSHAKTVEARNLALVGIKSDDEDLTVEAVPEDPEDPEG